MDEGIRPQLLVQKHNLPNIRQMAVMLRVVNTVTDDELVRIEKPTNSTGTCTSRRSGLSSRVQMAGFRLTQAQDPRAL